jgi:hypothetical protein
MRAFLVRLKNNNPWLLLLWHWLLLRKGYKSLRELTDLQAVNKLYFDYCGKYPNLKSPQTFSEKQQWMKLNYENPLMTICADKFAVRKYLVDKGYTPILSNVLGYYKSIEEIDINALPNKFVLKASHGSGWNLIVQNKADIAWYPWMKIMKCWLLNDIFWPGREWPYKNMPAGIICESYMEDASGELMDYKFHCFNGVPKYIQANKGRSSKRHAQNFYDLNWKILPFGKDLTPLPDVHIEKPHCLAEMLDIAKDLAKDFPFVRVDLYEVNKKVIFGEMTFFPKSGLPDFVPSEYDAIVGEYLNFQN